MELRGRAARAIRFLRLGLLVPLAGCGGLTKRGEPAEREDLPAPTSSATYENAAEPDDHRCYHTGPCDRFRLTWPAGTRVRIELRSEDVRPVLFVEDERIEAPAGEPVVHELQTEEQRPIRILAASAGYYEFGDYELVVTPKPIAEVELPDPKSPWDRRKPKRRAVRKTARQGLETPGLETRADMERALRDSTRGHQRERSFRIDLASPSEERISVQRGFCYVLVLRLEEGARWSEKAARSNVSFRFQAEDQSLHAGPGVIGRGAASRIGCPLRSRDYTLRVSALGGEQAPLGTGAATAALYVRRAERGELRRLAREQREQLEHSRREAERRKREHCGKCRREHYADQDGFERCAAQFYDREACY